MRLRAAVIVIAGLLLSGCTTEDWDSATSYVGLGQSDAQADFPDASPPDTSAPAPGPAANAGTPSSFCAGAARSAAGQAAQDGVDRTGQQKVAEDSYRDCVAKAQHGTVLD
jgi:hypothetical protein